MGRRSLPDYPNAMEAYQQLLADEYNESLMNKMENVDGSLGDSVAGTSWTASGGGGGSGRLAELLRSRERVLGEDYVPKVSRDERSSGTFYANR